MKRILPFLLSRRLAVLAMLALTGLLVLASLVPELDGAKAEALRRERPGLAFVAERFNAAELVQTPPFLLLPGFIALSVMASMAERLRNRHRSRKRVGAAQLERFVAHWSAELPFTAEEAGARVERGLRKARFATGSGGAGSGSRRAAGFWGSMLFHAGLLVVLGGTCMSALGRFAGELVLTEGIPLKLEPSTLLAARPPERMRALEGTRITLSDVSATYASPDRLIDVAGVLAIDRPAGETSRELASVNEAVWLGDFEATLHRYGFAAEVQAQDPAGKLRAAGTARVRVQPAGAEDDFALEGGGTLRLRLYPDYTERKGQPALRSAEPLRPVLGFRWLEGDREVAAGLVPRGGEAVVNGYRVAFPGLRYWAHFRLSRDPGFAWFTVGALLCVAGLAARFGWPEQAWRAEIRPAPGGVHVDVTLSSRWYPASLEERLERLRRVVENPGSSR